MLTADTITDEQIIELRTKMQRVKRQNAYTRAIRKDCEGALAGSTACRESCANAWNKGRGYASLPVVLPVDLVDAIHRYIATDWADGRDPSKIGALNAVAYIGERLVAIVAKDGAG